MYVVNIEQKCLLGEPQSDNRENTDLPGHLALFHRGLGSPSTASSNTRP